MEASPLPPYPRDSFQSPRGLRSYHQGERMSGELGGGTCTANVRRRVRRGGGWPEVSSARDRAAALPSQGGNRGSRTGSLNQGGNRRGSNPRKPKIATMPTMDAQTARLVDAVIVELIAEAERSGNERRRRFEEGSLSQANTGKTIRETLLYPVLIATGLMGAGGALFAALSKACA